MYVWDNEMNMEDGMGRNRDEREGWSCA